MSLAGVMNAMAGNDPFLSLLLCDIDTAGATAYYGFQSMKGPWLIYQHTLAAGSIRYALGETGYSANWTNRASLTYTLPGALS